uniref:Arachidonate lipoxygenase 3 n=1 Tax=Varanus komodoensis TaxID=61221 RepID=A0A8D2LYP8_VARKO
ISPPLSQSLPRPPAISAMYKVLVATGDVLLAGTYSSISITLIGARGESPKQRLDHLGRDFIRGAVDEYEVSCEQDLGPLLMVRLHKDPYLYFPSDNWFCRFVRVKTPQDETYHFPSYQWMEGYGTLTLREGTGMVPPPSWDLGCSGADPSPCSVSHRGPDLYRVADPGPLRVQLQPSCTHRRKLPPPRPLWTEYAPGWPRCLNVGSTEELNSNSKYLFTMTTVFAMRTAKSNHGHFLSSEYVTEHWVDDDFFGYQYLNGVNPVIIRKCTKIPENFPVTQEMVAGSLAEGTSLQKELEVSCTTVQQPLRAAQTAATQQVENKFTHCLAHPSPSISQTPGPENPIFLPSDSTWDWMLAKIWVRLANFHVHEVNTHLLEAHFLGEVYTMATLRQLPMCHPIYKLLIPHTRYIFHINTLARTSLLQAGGLLDKATSTGREGMLKLLARGLQATSYTSLCLPDDLEDRGVTSLPNYYYRDDGMKIWAAIEKYVSGIVGFYYKSDAAVKGDSELQAWIHEIFTEGFLSRKSSGVPSSLETAPELIRFLTMVIYCCSARHSAVNSGQFDFAAWIPNTPPTLRQPPPKVKGATTLQSVLDTLPDDLPSTCIRRLGNYPDEHFTEDEPKRHIAAFQAQLAEISKEIKERNQMLPLSYSYMDPAVVENSVTV